MLPRAQLVRGPPALSADPTRRSYLAWHAGRGYGFAYDVGKPPEQVRLTLYRTADGLTYETVTTADLSPATIPTMRSARRRGTASSSRVAAR